MRGFKNNQGTFFHCSEIGERNWVLRLVGSGDIGPTARNFTKNPSQRLDTGIIPTPWWFTPECEQQLLSIGEDGKIPAFIKAEASASNSLIAELTEEQLRNRLKTQLEYYFSRENLNQDRYLRSQMDNDQYVPIQIVASFPKISQLTSDQNLIISVLKESINVQVDETNTKVRAAHRRCTLLLREIPEFTDDREVKAMFIGCPPYTSLKYGLNNSWYVTFETEEATQLAFLHLQNLRKSFNGKQICVRIKTGSAPMPDPSANDPRTHSPATASKADMFAGLKHLGISTITTSKGYITGFPATASFTLNPNCTRVTTETELNLNQLMGPFGYSIRAIFQPKDSEPPKNEPSENHPVPSLLLPSGDERKLSRNENSDPTKNSSILGPPSTQIVESMLSAAAEANETKKREREVQKQQWQQIMDNLAPMPMGGQRITDMPFIKRAPPVLHRFVSQESADIEVALDIQRAARKQEKEVKQQQQQQIEQQQVQQQQQQALQQAQQQQQLIQQQKLLQQQQQAQAQAQQQQKLLLQQQQQQQQVQQQQKMYILQQQQQQQQQQQLVQQQHQSFPRQPPPHLQHQYHQQPQQQQPQQSHHQQQAQPHYSNNNNDGGGGGGYRQNNNNPNRTYSDRSNKDYNQYNGYSSGERSNYDNKSDRRSNPPYRGGRSYDARSDRSSGKSDNYSSKSESYSKNEGYNKNDNYKKNEGGYNNRNENYNYKPREKNNDRNYNNSTTNNYHYDRSSNYSNQQKYEKPRYPNDRRPQGSRHNYLQNHPSYQQTSTSTSNKPSTTNVSNATPATNTSESRTRAVSNPLPTTTKTPTTPTSATIPPKSPSSITPSSTTPAPSSTAIISGHQQQKIVIPTVIVQPSSSSNAPSSTTTSTSTSTPPTTTTIIHSDAASTTSSSARKKDNSESSEYNFVDVDFPILVEKQKAPEKPKEKAKFSAVVAGKKNDVKKSYAQTLKRQESKQSS